ncbi:MAG: hypothetical protein NTW28_07445 [Candidatus Solibacter sp.]|nr:hypothetical protein [Candidatus Solibacter sp.]
MMLPLLLTALALKPTLDHPPAITGNGHPARVLFTGHISADAPGPVKYTWVRSDKPSTATFTLNFAAPGSLPVTYDWLLNGPADGWVVLAVIAPEAANSGKVRFHVKCGN